MYHGYSVTKSCIWETTQPYKIERIIAPFLYLFKNIFKDFLFSFEFLVLVLLSAPFERLSDSCMLNVYEFLHIGHKTIVNCVLEKIISLWRLAHNKVYTNFNVVIRIRTTTKYSYLSPLSDL